MSKVSDDKATFREIFDDVVEKLDTDGRGALDTLLELEEQMVGKYQDHLDSLLEKQAEVHREFTRLVSTAFSNSSQLHSHYRKSVRDSHDTLIKAHLDLVRGLRSNLTSSKPTSESGGEARSGTGRKPRTRKA